MKMARENFLQKGLKSVLLCGLVLTASLSMAQKTTSLNEQIQVIRAYKPVLGESYKIKKSPYFFDETGKTPQVSYTFKDLRLTKDTAHSSITPDSLKSRDSASFPFLYARAAAGNVHTILGEIYLNSKPTASGWYGAWFKHLSEKGSLSHQEFKREELSVHGKRVFGTNYLSASLFGYENLVNFYGYDHSKLQFSASDTRQSLRDLELQAEFASTPDSLAGFLYSLKGSARSFSDQTGDKEQHLQASGHIGYTVLNMLGFDLAAQILYNNLQQEQGSSTNNSIFRIVPSVTLSTRVVRLKAGLNLVSDIGDNHRIQIFPDLAADLLFDQGFNLFGGIKGDLIQNTYLGYSQENPWLKGAYAPIPNFNTLVATGANYITYNLYNTRQNFFFFAGIKGAFGKQFNYRGQLEAGTYDNLPFFINNPADARKFTVVYDSKGTGREKLSFELNFLPSDRFRFQAGLDAVAYRLKSLAEAWHVPPIQGMFAVFYSPDQKLLIHTGLNFSARRYATLGDPNSDGGKVTLSSYSDWNLGAEFRFTKKFSVFAEGNNLLNKTYQNYLNYPVFGIQGKLGLSLRF